MKDQKRFATLALSAIMVVSMAGSVSAAQKVESKDDLAGATIGVQLVQQVTLMHLIMRKTVHSRTLQQRKRSCSGIKSRSD